MFLRALALGITLAVTSGAWNADSPATNGDGSRVVFETFERLDPAADVNAADRDVYLRDIVVPLARRPPPATPPSTTPTSSARPRRGERGRDAPAVHNRGVWTSATWSPTPR